ncbi:MAG: hypothetical protein N2378_04325 [Chloroflexaceae bacterium]|nr:hypothetical protein [Chloroflexaceae bacterium]
MTGLRPGFDTLTLPAQFGVRCYDLLTGVVVSAGLEVRLWPVGRPTGLVKATRTSAGYFVAEPLPGPAAPRPWTVEVRDSLGRFLPLRFTALAPLASPQGPALASPPVEALALLERAEAPLFSAPTRPVPPGVGLVLADLWAWDERPAAWAVVTARTAPRGAPGALVGLGMADQAGRLALPIRMPGGGRAGDGATLDHPLTIRLQAYFARAAGTGAPAAPDLAEALAQPAVELLASHSPPTALGEFELFAGRPLALVTGGAERLHIAPPG